MEIEVLNLIYTLLISSLAVFGYYNILGRWKVILLILIGKVILPG